MNSRQELASAREGDGGCRAVGVAVHGGLLAAATAVAAALRLCIFFLHRSLLPHVAGFASVGW
jgi:hypothetical protein